MVKSFYLATILALFRECFHFSYQLLHSMQLSEKGEGLVKNVVWTIIPRHQVGEWRNGTVTEKTTTWLDS